MTRERNLKSGSVGSVGSAELLPLLQIYDLQHRVRLRWTLGQNGESEAA